MNAKKNATIIPQNLSTKISSIYGIHSSSEVAGAVYDYCKDHGIAIDYDSFRTICRLISCREEVALPTLSLMKHLHQLLLTDLEAQ